MRPNHSELGIRRNPDGPDNPAKRTHLEIAARFVGWAGASTLGGVLD